MINSKKQTLRALSLLIFLLSIGEGLTAQAIPLLGKSIGASYSLIGFFMTGYSVAYGVLTMLSGRISDLLGRKKVLFWSIVICLLASLGYCFSPTAASLFFFRTLEGMSRGALWVVMEAILADNTTPAGRSAASGRFTAAYGIGDMTGCLLGGFLMQYAAFSAVFPFYPLLCLLSLFLMVRGIQDIRHGEGADAGEHLSPRPGAWRAEIKKIWPACYIIFTYAGFLYSLMGLLSMVASYSQVSYLGIGVIFAIFWGCRVVSFLSAGSLEKKWGRKHVILGGIIFASASAATFIVAPNFPLLMVACALGGIGTGLIFTLVIALVADAASPGYRGFDMGVMEFSGSLGMIIQTAISGLLGDFGGVRLTYLFTLIVCLIGIGVIILFLKPAPIAKE